MKVEGTPAKLRVPNLGQNLEIIHHNFQKNPLAKDKHPKHQPSEVTEEVPNATAEQEETMDSTAYIGMTKQKEMVDKMTNLVIKVDCHPRQGACTSVLLPEAS